MDTIDITAKKEAYIHAFTDQKYQDKIIEYRNVIERMLNCFINDLPEKQGTRGYSDSGGRNSVLSIGSRIKSSRSFEEKLSRKDYIHEWLDSNDITQLQDEISSKLPDLIGFRITCLFHADEEKLFHRLYEYFNSKYDNMHLDPKPEKGSESLTQKNGRPIYKVTGKYSPQGVSVPICFEVQIKSNVHNIWGEVEHKTTYKGKQYEIELNHKKTMTDEIYNVLVSSDKQLESLYNRNHTESDLVKALFAEQTRAIVSKKIGTEYLAEYYETFFELFSKKLDSEIRTYVACKLNCIDETYLKKEIQLSTNKDMVDALVHHLKNDYKGYYLDALKYIADELIIFRDKEEFLSFIADVEIAEINAFSIVDEDCNIVNDSFGDDPDSDNENRPIDNNTLTDALTKLKEALKNAKKGDK